VSASCWWCRPLPRSYSPDGLSAASSTIRPDLKVVGLPLRRSWGPDSSTSLLPPMVHHRWWFAGRFQWLDVDLEAKVDDGLDRFLLLFQGPLCKVADPSCNFFSCVDLIAILLQ
jgi:hypothetical protein